MGKSTLFSPNLLPKKANKNSRLRFNGMRIIEMIIDEANLASGIQAISIVDKGAIESDFVKLAAESEAKEVRLATVNSERRILMGAALIPNKMIYRSEEGTEGYYMYFSEATVRRCAELFFQKGNQNKATLQHEIPLDGLTVFESWIKEDETYDKSVHFGLDVPNGSWIVSMKVNNEDVWNEYVKTGKVNGFSIEGYFSEKANLRSAEAELLEKIREILTSNN